MHEISLSRSDDLFAEIRRMVEAGAQDGPATVFYDGAACLALRSLYAAATLTVSENPAVRFVPYKPHPMARTGPRIEALLMAAEARRQSKRASGPRKTTGDA